MIRFSEKILIVEDIKDTLNLYVKMLEEVGYNVTGVLSGKEGLKVLKKKEFDIILLDIMMPGMDGLEFAKKVRKFSDIPIIVVSIKDDELTIAKSKEIYSVVDYIVKPCTKDRLVKGVKTALDNS